MQPDGELYLRNIVFGISDSLVSTVGLLSGIDISGTAHQTIILTGIIYAFVEAFSMAVGSFISEESAEEYAAKGIVKNNKPLVGGVVMFVSFVLAAFIPILPYLVWNTACALWASIAFSIIALFIVGIVSAKFSKVNMLARGLQTALLGGAAIAIGALVGKFVKA